MTTRTVSRRRQALHMTVPIITASWVVTQVLWPSPSTRPDADARGLFPATEAAQLGFNQQALSLVDASAARAGTTSFTTTLPLNAGDQWLFISCDTGTYSVTLGGRTVTGQCVGHAQGVEAGGTSSAGRKARVTVALEQAGRWGIATYTPQI